MKKYFIVIKANQCWGLERQKSRQVQNKNSKVKIRAKLNYGSLALSELGQQASQLYGWYITFSITAVASCHKLRILNKKNLFLFWRSEGYIEFHWTEIIVLSGLILLEVPRQLVASCIS